MRHGIGLLAAVACVAVASLAPADARPLEDIKARGVVSLCAAPNALPFASKRGSREGTQIELARVIAGQLGVGLEVDWVVTGSQRGRVDCDLVMDAIVDPQTLMEDHLRWSTPYQRGGVALALRPGLDGIATMADLPPDARVGVMMGTFAHMILERRGVRTLPFGFEDELVAAAASGEIDAAAVTAASIGYYNATHPDRQVRLVDAFAQVPELNWDLAVAMRRSDRFLRDAMDRIVRQLMTDGTFERIYASYGIAYRAPVTHGPKRIERRSTVGEEECVRMGYSRECSPSR